MEIYSTSSCSTPVCRVMAATPHMQQFLSSLLFFSPPEDTPGCTQPLLQLRVHTRTCRTVMAQSNPTRAVSYTHTQTTMAHPTITVAFLNRYVHEHKGMHVHLHTHTPHTTHHTPHTHTTSTVGVVNGLCIIIQEAIHTYIQILDIYSTTYETGLCTHTMFWRQVGRGHRPCLRRRGVASHTFP